MSHYVWWFGLNWIQGFLKVAEVDGRGKPHKLPLKAEIRKAMSLPGSATLMVCHLRAAFTQSHCSTTYISCEINTGEKTPSAGAIQIHAIEEGAKRAPSEATYVGPWVMRTSDGFSPTTRPCNPLKCSNVDLPLCTNLQSSIRNSAKAGIFCSQANTQGHDDEASRSASRIADVKTPAFYRTLKFAGVNEPTLPMSESNRVNELPKTDSVVAVDDKSSVLETYGNTSANVMLEVPQAVGVVNRGKAFFASKQPMRDANTVGTALVPPLKKRPYNVMFSENLSNVAALDSANSHLSTSGKHTPVISNLKAQFPSRIWYLVSWGNIWWRLPVGNLKGQCNKTLSANLWNDLSFFLF